MCGSSNEAVAISFHSLLSPRK